MQLSIRQMTEADLAACIEISKAAFNRPQQGESELGRLFALQPDGWLMAEFGDTPVGLGGAINYGPFGYVGLMSVLPSMQGHGIGRALMDRLLEWFRVRACPTVLLDASPAGFPLYDRLGFEVDDMALVLRRAIFEPVSLPPPPRHGGRISPMKEEDIPALTAFDTPYFGATRPRVLASYLADDTRRAFVARNEAGKITGYLIAQVNGRLGPWVATSADDAEWLLLHALELPFEREKLIEGGNLSVLVPAANREAERLLLRYGFYQQRALRHMRLGDPVPHRDRTKQYGQASFAIG